MSAAARAFTDGFDEAWAAPGEPREHYRALLDAFEQTDLPALQAALDAEVAAQGVTFDGRPFAMSPVPRLLPADEAARLAAGLEQRARALNAFVVDAYGERRIVAAGVIAEWVIDTSDGLEAALVGCWPGGATPIGVAGLDLVRASDGELRVLEDNVRTPSGWSYAIAAVRAVSAACAARGLQLPAHLDGAGALLDGLTGAIRGAVPAGRDAGDPVVVVLADGPEASAHYEHAVAARHLGAPLLRPDDVVRDGAALAFRDGEGRRQRIDVVYRRCDADRLHDDDGAPTAVGALLLEPWLAGEIAIVNGFGTGVADDKLVHAYVEEMIGFYLGEEPLLASVRTLDLTRDADLGRLLEAPEEHVVKPRLGQGGAGVVVCAHAKREDVTRCLTAVRERPEEFVAQPTVALSTHPAVVDGALVARHVDLRPFVFSAPGWTQAVPAGLTRVAWEEGSLVVNSSQDGGGKATLALR